MGVNENFQISFVNCFHYFSPTFISSGHWEEKNRPLSCWMGFCLFGPGWGGVLTVPFFFEINKMDKKDISSGSIRGSNGIRKQVRASSLLYISRVFFSCVLGSGWASV